MTETPRRPTCPRCQRPLRACLCAWVRPVSNRVPVLVLQHPQEASHAKSSLRLLRLSLQRCRCETGIGFDADSLAGWLGASAVLLYPGPAAASTPPAPSAEPGLLVLLDGTWRQTRQLLQLNPRLQALPRCPFPAGPALPPSRYRIRRAQRPEHRSTLEAAALALGGLEGRPAHYAPLLQAFEGWVGEEAARAGRVGPGFSPS